MKAYKCDICGKFIDDCYVNNSDAFDLYKDDLRILSIKSDDIIKIREMCKECYFDIKKYIHERYRNYHN